MNQASELQNLLSAPWQHFRSLPSTNDFLAELSVEDWKEGFTCSAEHQTGGHGQHGRSWASPFGGLYMSVSLRPDLDPGRWPLLSLVASVSSVESLQEFLPDTEFQIKWPNDIILHDKKIGGILLESSISNTPRLIVGLGLNLANHKLELPDRLLFPASSVAIETGIVLCPHEVAGHYRRRLLCRYLRWKQDPHSIISDFLRLSFTKGRQIHILHRGETLTGRDDGLNESGHLRLILPSGIKEFQAGSITSVVAQDTNPED